LCCHERNFELHFVVYKADYKQVEVAMTKRNQKTLKTQELQIQAIKLKGKSELAPIDLPPRFPFEDAVCLKEHKKLFENLFKGKKLT
jgi:hypothetical protein